MQKFVTSVLLILFLIPFSEGFSEEFVNTPSTLTVSLENTSPFVYKDSDGYTVVVGAVENNDLLTSVTNVSIQVKFFDDINPNPLDIVQGSTVLKVIPQEGQSPFVIRSSSPNPEITQASVSLLGFDSSADKKRGLALSYDEVFVNSLFNLSGIVQNGGAPSTDTNVYVAFYDGFEPPRILQVSTIELGKIAKDTKIPFKFNEKIDSRAVKALLFAESNIFYSNSVDIDIPASQVLTKLVSIIEVSVRDAAGSRISEVAVGATVNIESKTLIQSTMTEDMDETPYTYYVQIKKFGESPYVEFIGKYEGRFVGTDTQLQIIDWVPKNKGVYFIETFVWDRDNVPIAEKGPFVLFVVK